MEIQMKRKNQKIEKEYKENGIKITRYETPKRKDETIIQRGSKTMHQKGAFGWRPPTGNGVSSIYFSEHERKPRNGGEAKSNGKLTDKRAW
jgi:hypothetical protein